ncbi:MAG: DegT/DnrJ/EryC1/StrS family aminotransferase [bacterium]
MKIPITKPYFTEDEEKAVIEVLRSGWVCQGAKVAEFETQFADWTQAKYAIATSSCTTALHLTLIACGIGAGNEVIVPSFTFVATANAVEYQQAKPVFVDISLKSFNLDVEKIEEKITRKTKAIIPVHLFGLSAEMGPILELATKYNLKVIEDAACGIGTKYKGKPVGTFGDAGCFSFHPRKSVTTGEGGMITTDDSGIAEKVKMLRDHGASVSDIERHKKGEFTLPEYNLVGYNYRMTDIQGALGIAQMKKLELILERRRELAQRYNEALKDISWISLPWEMTGYHHTYQSYVLLINDDAPVLRDDLALRLINKGISVRQGTHAVHTLGYYRQKYNIEPADFPASLKAHNQSLTLPLYFNMSAEEQNYVIDALKE